jgi:hypothetical protein
VHPNHFGEKCILYNKGESFCIKGEKKMDTQFRGELEFAHICSGGACVHAWGAICVA